jgi:type I site-specific restriction endonuclease
MAAGEIGWLLVKMAIGTGKTRMAAGLIKRKFAESRER